MGSNNGSREKPLPCHWQELPQGPFLSWQTCVCPHKHVFCSNKNMLAMTNLLSWQNYVWQTKYFCTDKIFLSQQKTNICHDKRRVLSQRTCVCHNKSKIVATKLVATKLSLYLSQQNVCHNTNMFAATNVILRQAYFLPQQKMCLSRQKWYLCQLLPMIPPPPLTLHSHKDVGHVSSPSDITPPR